MMQHKDGDWWIECDDDGDFVMREQFSEEQIKIVAFVRNGWFGMPRGSLITPRQASALARKAK
jgi:hypothetical protein